MLCCLNLENNRLKVATKLLSVSRSTAPPPPPLPPSPTPWAMVKVRSRFVLVFVWTWEFLTYSFFYFAFRFSEFTLRRVAFLPLMHPILWVRMWLRRSFLVAPSWTCTISDWTKSLKTEGWSRCSGENSLLNGLQRGENGGLEDFVDRLEGAWCCSPPSQYKQKGLKCRKSYYFENW